MTTLENITRISAEIQPAQLLVVTKHRSADEIREVIKAGVKQIGENRLQEIQEKYDEQLLSELKEKNVQLHFIGQLQSNKVSKVVSFCDVIQSVDSFELAEKINQAAEAQGKNIAIFLQLNLTDEEQKSGFSGSEEELRTLVEKVQSFSHIDLLGFMCMGKEGDEEETRKAFRECKRLANQFQLPEVSMGMSQDYQIAVEEGATLVRLGSIIFE